LVSLQAARARQKSRSELRPLINVQVLDHVIVGADDSISFAEPRLL
jgi:DNA repair protein RadC